MKGGNKESGSDKRERGPPDTTNKPEGKALKTSGAASSAHGTTSGRGTNTLDPASDDEDSSEEDEQAAMLGLEQHRKLVKTIEQAQEVAKKMHHSLPAWKLNDCIKHLWGDTPNLLGVVRASNVYFQNVQVAKAAA